MAEALLLNGVGGGLSSDDLTATKDDILIGNKAITNDSNDDVVEGTMPNSTFSSTKSCSSSVQSVNIPYGYHDGTGKVSVNNLTATSATAAYILKGKTAYTVSGSTIS